MGAFERTPTPPLIKGVVMKRYVLNDFGDLCSDARGDYCEYRDVEETEKDNRRLREENRILRNRLYVLHDEGTEKDVDFNQPDVMKAALEASQ